MAWTSVGSLALLAACPTKDTGTPATDTAVTDTTDTTATATTATTDSPGPPSSTVDMLTTEVTPTGATSVVTTDTGGTTSEGTTTAATATDTTATSADTTATATDTSPDTDTDTESEPAMCPEADPAVDATFAVTLFDWPGTWTEMHFIDVLCIVDAVTLEGGMVVTALTCDHEGEPRLATVSIVAAPEGDVTWAAGDSVQLDSMALDDDVSVPTRAVTMRTPDKQQLLLVAVDGAEEADEPTRFEPLLYTTAEFCDLPPWGDDGGILATVTLERPMGASLSLNSGTRGSFAADAGRVYAFDLREAVVGACCHGNDILQLLVRRVAIDG
ncbi:hypothetical protein [Nannocystis sp. SCPEA4]|uniref:hypothetical protein n=1 Tax=Nannocystis sp. SCPEA4 TaxID=2996787 RepID=UPI00226EA60D|nr:hypothetical protein [Nannocystis sp. SCPEA4]MCY1058372.1 hypothetical protein [Nannocystis sp. SCPEA4]